MTIQRTYANRVFTMSRTRPSDVLPYIAGDSIANSTTATVANTWTLPALYGGYITRAILKTSKGAHVEPIRLLLFQTALNPANDNTPQTISLAASVNLIGEITFATFKTGVTATDAAWSEGVFDNQQTRMQYRLQTNLLYGLLIAGAPFTPTSAQQFNIDIYTEVSA
jgi:hypothetical protein